MSRNQLRISLPPDPFEGIAISPELNTLHARIIGPEDASFLADVEAKLRQDCPPIELAMLIVSYVGPAVVRLLGPVAQNMLQSDGTMSPSVREELGRRVISIAQAIEADITEGIDPYPMLAQKTVCYACSRLRTEIQRVAGNTPVVFGTVVQTLYLASSGDASDYYVQRLVSSAAQAAVRVLAFTWCRAINLADQQPKSLKYLVGLSSSEDPFICDQMRTYAKREEYESLEAMRGPKYLNLPREYRPEYDSEMKHFERRIWGDNPEDHRTMYPLINVLLEGRYRRAAPNNQRGYLRNAVFNQCRNRIKEDEREHIKASRQKISLESLGDRVGHKDRKARVQSRTVEEVLESTPQHEVADRFGHHERHFVDLKDVRDQIERLRPKDHDLADFVEAYHQPGMSLRRIPEILTCRTGTVWDQHRLDSARKRFRDVLPFLRENLTGHLYAVFCGNRTYYREQLPDGHSIWQHLPQPRNEQ